MRRAIRSYRDLEVWQKGVQLYRLINALIRTLGFSDRLVFDAQTRRAARGISVNIAEGFRRWDLGDYVRSVSYACGSLGEVETDLVLMEDCEKIDRDLLMKCRQQCEELSPMLTNLGVSLRRVLARNRRQRG